jgi:hypothetical protein
MGKKESSSEQDDDTRIKVPESDDSYLETVSWEGTGNYKLQPTTCSICGLSARTKEELEDHFRNAHKEAKA